MRSGRDERSDGGGRRDGPRRTQGRVLPDATAPIGPVAAGDEVAIVAGLFNGKVGIVLTTAASGDVEVTVGRLRMTIPHEQVRKIVR